MLDKVSDYFILGLFGMTILLCVNLYLMQRIENKTRYKKFDYHNYGTKFILMYMFLGFTFLIFPNKVKRYRKDNYLLKELKYLKMQINMCKDFPELAENEIKEYNNIMRYVKLQKIRKRKNGRFCK